MSYRKPLPTFTEPNMPFWNALKEHRFMVPKCRDCGHYNWTPYPACKSCLSEDQEWVEVSGEGSLYTYSVIHRGPGAFGEEVPYILAVAQLKESPRPMLVMSNLINVEIPDVHIGMPLRVTYEKIPDEDVTLWRFEPA
ncbi:Zn-ribbon domain-containing OB-fold protein [Dehalococcoidia bacterium]|nr:Zn-ribbon domain-containing OB-fold protein [Dehalococcoidia bacterium]